MQAVVQRPVRRFFLSWAPCLQYQRCTEHLFTNFNMGTCWHTDLDMTESDAPSIVFSSDFPIDTFYLFGLHKQVKIFPLSSSPFCTCHFLSVPGLWLVTPVNFDLSLHPVGFCVQ